MVSRGKPSENSFEISFLKSLQMHPILKTSSYIWGTHLLILFSLHFSIVIGGGGGVSPPAPPLGMALNAGKTILEAKVKKANKD